MGGWNLHQDDVIYPDDDEEVAAKLEEKFNVKPQVGNLLDPQPFWFSLFVESGDSLEQVQFVESLEMFESHVFLSISLNFTILIL